MEQYVLSLASDSSTSYKMFKGNTPLTDAELTSLFSTAGSAYFAFAFGGWTPSSTSTIQITNSSDVVVMENTGLTDAVTESKNYKGTWSANATTFDSFTELSGKALDESQLSFLMKKIKESGGSSVNVVQTAGTSTTDVMSQKAASNLVYPTGHEATGDSVNVGVHTHSLGAYGILINPREDTGTISGSGHSNIAIGTRISMLYAGNSNVLIGMSNNLNRCTGSVAIGYQAGTNDSSSGLTVANGAVAIGGGNVNSYFTLAGHTDSVALGSGARTTATNQVSVGRGSETGGGPATRSIVNVTDPTNAQDAATKNYVDSIYPVGAVFTSTSSTAPTIAGGTWTEIGTQTIGSSTVHYYERTA